MKPQNATESPKANLEHWTLDAVDNFVTEMSGRLEEVAKKAAAEALEIIFNNEGRDYSIDLSLGWSDGSREMGNNPLDLLLCFEDLTDFGRADFTRTFPLRDMFTELIDNAKNSAKLDEFMDDEKPTAPYKSRLNRVASELRLLCDEIEKAASEFPDE